MTVGHESTNSNDIIELNDTFGTWNITIRLVRMLIQLMMLMIYLCMFMGGHIKPI